MLKKPCSLLPFKKNRSDGFTLIELSIVLLIIGFVTAGVLVGRSLIRSSEVMSVIIDEDKYYKAARAFRDKYNALPGDMTNATSFWGAASSCPISYYVSAAQTATCNGDGNGIINSDGTGQGLSNSWENFTAWQQLADAGFIQGAYNGGPGNKSSYQFIPNFNAPLTRITGATFEFYSLNASGRYFGNLNGYYSGASVLYNQQYLMFGGGSSNFDLLNPVLTGPEAASIDTKIDDGAPSTGMLFAGGQDANSNYCGSGAGYASNSSRVVCYLLFTIQW